MLLLDDLFKIESSLVQGNTWDTSIILDPDHIIFKGHFPGHPVTPGVIQLQITQELLEFYLGKKLVLHSLIRSKFLHVLNPLITSQLVIQLVVEKEGDAYKVKAMGVDKGQKFFSLNAIFNIRQ